MDRSVEGPTLSRGQYLVGPGQFRLQSADVAAPGPGEIQVSVRATTLCGSDIHYFQKGRNGTIEVREPLCLGHEAAGEVVAVGSGTEYQLGDRVAIECGVPCGDCELCNSARYNLCPRLRFRGSGSAWPHFQGTMQTRINHPAQWIHRLPENISFAEGALLEPLAVAIHASQRADISSGTSCSIIGAGAIGLLCAVAARARNCAHIAIADIVPARVQFALDNGFADVGYVVTGKRATTLEESIVAAEEIARNIAALTLPRGGVHGLADYTFECTGVETCVQAGVYTTKAGGKLILVGMGTPNIVLPVSNASAREVDIIPTWRYANCYSKALEIVSDTKRAGSKLPQLSSIITHRFQGFEEVPKALQTACMAKDPEGQMVIKVVVENSES